VRLGGDEFAVLAPLTSTDDIQALAARIRHTVHRAGIAASVGYAHAPHDGHDLDTLVQTADLSMYSHKTERRARARAASAPAPSTVAH
jgi:diguanylate cyclase (GGDEF)-like protein